MSRSNDDKPSPSALAKLLGAKHKDAETLRAIADTAKGRRIKAQQTKDDKKGKK